jgi:hypothetical protein
LRSKKKIAKEDDGVYILQTQTSTTKSTTPKFDKTLSMSKLKQENDDLYKFCLEWRSKYDKLEEKTNGLRNLVADQSAIIRYLEAKIFKGEPK